MRKLILSVVLVLSAALLYGAEASAFSNSGSCGGDCRTCHSFKTRDAQDLLGSLNPQVKVLGVDKSPVGGLWQVTYEFRGQKGITYIDFEKKHIIEGKIIDIKSRADITDQKLSEMNRVDFSKIPVKDALIMGKADAPIKAIVFDDPE
ncbi:MAG: hypothetical protein M0Z59_09535 [Nitrospiraceae bacterium]|nr:hypothetical protein [Nitrospiraceae bacterium]